jgi:hypothetical protein
MLPAPVYQLLSLESEIERPRLLRTGSLAACLDELKEAVLIDNAACNRSVLRITATLDDGDARRSAQVVEILTATTTGEQP